MKTIDADVKMGQYKQSYLLYGSERYLKKQYRDKLLYALAGSTISFKDNMNVSAFEGGGISPGEIIDLAETLPFLAERRVILIENSGFFKNGCEELAAYLLQTAPDTCFVFVEEDVDKRSKMYKAVKKLGRAVEFTTQTEDLLTRWILTRLKKEGKNIRGSAMQLFLSKTGTDMGNIDRELEKLICYTLGRDAVEEEDIEAITVGQVTNKIFDMVNAIAEHDQRRSLELYYDLLTLKEPPMRILYLLIRQFQVLLVLQDMLGKGFDTQTMAQKAGIPGFAVRRNLAQARGFSTAQLKRSLRDGAELEEFVKTGRMNDQLAVELFLIRYSQIKDGQSAEKSER